VKIVFNEVDLLPDYMKDCLLNMRRKEILLKSCRNKLPVQFYCNLACEVTTTFGKRFWTPNDGVKDLVHRQDEVHKEADNRMFTHVKDFIDSSFWKKIIGPYWNK
jgi:hypothetical protein